METKKLYNDNSYLLKVIDSILEMDHSSFDKLTKDNSSYQYLKGQIDILDTLKRYVESTAKHISSADIVYENQNL